MELMVTLAIVAVLAGIAAPNLQGWIGDARVKAAAVQVRGTLNAARSTAISRGRAVRVELAEDAVVTCLVADPSGRCAGAAPDDIIANASLDVSTLRVGIDGGADAGVAFDRRGRLAPFGTDVRFTFCDGRGPGSGLRVALDPVGRTTLRSLSDVPSGRCP